MKKIATVLFVIIGLLALWQGTILLFKLPNYILPTPTAVLAVSYERASLILHEALITITETIVGLVLGVFLGCIAALTMVFCRPLKLWLLPILIISQAIPTFAIAPLLVIWFGYGMASKIATTIIMLFFPVTSAFYDGLRRTDPGWIDLANTMSAKKWRFFWYIRIPAALPSFASGMRVATAFAPIGAVVGEWVGSSSGLGFLMLNANARLQIDLMFAGMFALVVFSLSLYFIVDKMLRWAIPWQKV
jgi:putative hydroxymethylpyrimidine transport system permease protein